MIVDRRFTLVGLMGGAVLGAAPARASAVPLVTTLFIDTRRPASRSFAESQEGGRVIDIAAAEAWATARAFVPTGGRVRGLTRWSDWVLLRGALQDKRLRVRAETPIDPASTGDSVLFLWEMF